MMSPVAVAERLDVHANTVRRWIHDGLVPGTVRTPGGSYRVPEASADALLRPVTPRSAAATDHDERDAGAIFGPVRHEGSP